jgi:gluconate 2-dehydrogenase gamma chain
VRQYCEGLAALDRACSSKPGGEAFADLAAGEQDAVLHELEKGELKLEGVNGQAFFDQAVKDIQMGFLADPVYGGNRNMVAWKMIGFPGARYNYLDWVKRHNDAFRCRR